MDNNRRILIVDDNEAIHRDFQSILNPPVSKAAGKLAALESELFGLESVTPTPQPVQFELDSAYQGQEALARVELAMAMKQPYALIFMDVRMPPGWDGIETVARIWDRYPGIEVVICTAYSDYSLEAINKKLGYSEHLLFLRKPFDAREVQQIALALTQKWSLQQQLQRQLYELEHTVADRTRLLEKAKEAALQANHAKTNFMINMSHEVRSALNAILGYASYLEMSLDAQYHADLRKIEQAGQHLLDTTQDILQLCRMEAGELNLVIESFNFANLLEDVLLAIKPLLSEGTTLKAEGLEHVGLVSHDIKQLWQFFYTILKQMALWTKQGTILFIAETNAHLLQIRITAPATISPALLEQVFQDYSVSYADQPNKSLGLAISQRFCRLIGGYFNMEYIPQQGIVASIYLPIQVASTPAPLPS